jgi:hypothetical protein
MINRKLEPQAKSKARKCERKRKRIQFLIVKAMLRCLAVAKPNSTCDGSLDSRSQQSLLLMLMMLNTNISRSLRLPPHAHAMTMIVVSLGISEHTLLFLERGQKWRHRTEGLARSMARIRQRRTNERRRVWGSFELVPVVLVRVEDDVVCDVGETVELCVSV